MSGHSKWASIRHKKSAVDAKRGKSFTKVIREITVAARSGGGDSDANAQLRAAILKARALNMPNDNVERAIKKGTGELEGTSYVEVNYEGYGPGGIALLIHCLTDNKNRTAAEVRSILSKHGGNLGENGCVAYLFSRKGIIVIDAAQYTEDEVLEASLDADVENISSDETHIEVVASIEAFDAVLKALAAANISYETAAISRVPDTTISLDRELEEKAMRLIEVLDESDDVQEVANNLEILYAGDTGN